MQSESYSGDRMSAGGDEIPAMKQRSSSENHREAERKRRHRINAHLHTLRTLLTSTNSKTDKASLLAKVVESMKELTQQTSEIAKSGFTFPSEADELTVRQSQTQVIDGKLFIEATLCCEDRVDLIPDLIETLRTLPLTLVSAKLATLGGRIKNVIVLVGENKDKDRIDHLVSTLRDVLRTNVLKSGFGDGGRSKRRRMFDPTAEIYGLNK
ncbi:transcription factor bHLH106-like [Andrographis paniculata]|uniref:transcription factor bHLH106-like n=1 Tax=Andrographis paniculata TaxID=175694 RepID=UPI0021E8A453|nr:transcription factor bHLH106-like [Andrographis paniculata]